MEHVKYPDNTFSYKLQKLLAPIWSLFAGGCQVTRDTKAALDKVPFKSMDVQYILSTKKAMFLIRPHIWGKAIK